MKRAEDIRRDRLREPTLNAINAQIVDGRVRLDIVLDVNGLEKLRQKLDVLKSLIEEDDGEPAEDGI